jgi:hypothetical protein
MPKLVSGGKHTYGWTMVGEKGEIVLPPDALQAYRFREGQRLSVVPGSVTSGGFGLGSMDTIHGSPLEEMLRDPLDPGECLPSSGEEAQIETKRFCWVELHHGVVQIPPAVLVNYGGKIGDRLLVIRGSRRALGFAVRGLVVEEAQKHGDLKVFGRPTGETKSAAPRSIGK